MKNIEYKVYLGKDKKNLLKKMGQLGADYKGKLKQEDIYFNCAGGRLKLRKINNKHWELIFYQRTNSKKSRASDYEIIMLDNRHASQLLDLLKAALGQKVVVKKNRDLWIYHHTRIHLDDVEKLGNFLELETVVRGIDYNSAKKEHNVVKKLLNLPRYQPLEKSYSDFLVDGRRFTPSSRSFIS